MSIGTLLWQASNDGTSFTDMKTPSSYKLSWEDLDNNSYRSVITGNLVRKVVSRRWVKISLEYNYLTADEYNTIVSKVNKSKLVIKAKSPAFGSSSLCPPGAEGKWIRFEAYVSKFEGEMLEGQIGYSLSFNIVQSKKGDWQ